MQESVSLSTLLNNLLCQAPEFCCHLINIHNQWEDSFLLGHAAKQEEQINLPVNIINWVIHM